jgi:hypothetical protein
MDRHYSVVATAMLRVFALSCTQMKQLNTHAADIKAIQEDQAQWLMD